MSINMHNKVYIYSLIVVAGFSININILSLQMRCKGYVAYVI